MDTLSITNTTKTRTPRAPFAEVHKHILGARYELSLVLMGDHLATRLNREHKNRPGPTNILSFPIDKNEGEIFINLRRVERDAKKYGHTPREHCLFLFIHGCLHLAGAAHSPAMEKKEERLLKKFS